MSCYLEEEEERCRYLKTMYTTIERRTSNVIYWKRRCNCSGIIKKGHCYEA